MVYAFAYIRSNHGYRRPIPVPDDGTTSPTQTFDAIETFKVWNRSHFVSGAG
jgi:hypothetical protein